MRGSLCIPAMLVLSCAISRAEEEWKPAPSPLVSRYAAKVSPKEITPFEFYPRPTMGRKEPEAKNLMGLWDYAVTDVGAWNPPETYHGKLMVPYPLESALSGVKRKLARNEKLWCHLSCRIEWGLEWLGTRNHRLVLRFDGVSDTATVFVNGREVGSHRGGEDGFCFDVTDLIRDRGKHVMDVVVAITAGGARPSAEGGSRRPMTGISKPVWVEPVPASRIDLVRFVPDVDAGAVRVTVDGTPAAAEETLEVIVWERGAEAARVTGRMGEQLVLSLERPKLWTPELPFLYEYAATIRRGERIVDRVRSTFAMRKVSLGRGENGRTVVMLNDRPYFHLGVLDASWWPDGGRTIPGPEAVRKEIERIKQLGFNTVRKSFHTDQQWWYHWCDRLGLMVWQELPPGSPGELAEEYPRIIRQLGVHPCVTAWVLPDGISAGASRRLTRLIREADPSRLVVGGEDADVSELAPADVGKAGASRQARVLAPVGDIQAPARGHAWSADAAGSGADLDAGYMELARKMPAWRARAGLSGFVYKQLADAEDDHSGLISSDREAIKLMVEQVAFADPRFWPVPRIRMLVPSALSGGAEWRYATERPPDDWSGPAFDASSWRKGRGRFGPEDATKAPTTEWPGPDIWTRGTFALDAGKLREPWLVLCGRGDVDVFLNGNRIAERRGRDWPPREWFRVSGSAGVVGRNVLAVSAHVRAAEPLLDAGLFDFVPQYDCRLPKGILPIVDAWMRDPCICPAPDGTYYLVGTGTTANWKCDGIPLYKSPDLKQWDLVKIIVWREQFRGTWVLKDRVEKDVPIWAPELHFLKGTYWLTFCTGWAREGGRSGTGLLKSSTGKVEGPYELVNTDGPLTPGELDGSLFQDDDGTVYFLSGGRSIARMKEDMTGLAEKRRDIQFDDPQQMGFEGVFMFRANGRYYVANAGCPLPFSSYDCMVAMADSVDGPFTKVHIGVPHGGHNMFFKDREGNWWSTLFGGDHPPHWGPLRERPAIVPIEFAPDGTLHPLDPAPR